MRVVVAMGGNALLQRGQTLNAENQRGNIRVAAIELAAVHAHHQLVIAHGNGPQVGLLALQGNAYDAKNPYPLDVLGAETEGMIGYMIEQELGNLLPVEVPFATLLTQVEVRRMKPSVWPLKRAGRLPRMATSSAAWWPARGPSAFSRFARSSGCWRKAPS